MNLLWALFLFGINILDDTLRVLFISSIVSGSAMKSALYSGLLTGIGVLSIIWCVESSEYAIPVILGASVGTYIGVKLNESRKKKTKNVLWRD